MPRLATLIVLSLVVASSSPRGGAQSPRRPYQPTWESLDSRPVPSWYLDAKFGIFIHWGVYSVPSFANPQEYAEWYWHTLRADPGTNARNRENHQQTVDFHNRTFGPNFSYYQFAPMFRAELFDPDEWAAIIKQSGAKYVALTSKHHDGFCLFQSAEANRDWGQPWNAVDIGPRRDLLGDLSTAVRKAGLKMGFYYSLYEWFNPLWLNDRRLFLEKHMIPQFKDVVTRYKPSIIFGDGEWDMTSAQWRSPELFAWLYNDSPVKDEVVVNDRWGSDTRHKHGGYYTTEYGAGLPDATHPWEENRGMGFSYGYNRNEPLSNYRTGQELVWMFVDTVSRGGNLLLNIGPRADGKIPEIMQQRLKEIGDWLAVNGEAIYGTRACDAHRTVDRRREARAELRRIPGEVRHPDAGRPAAPRRARRQAGVLHEKGGRALRDHARVARLDVDVERREGRARHGRDDARRSVAAQMEAAGAESRHRHAAPECGRAAVQIRVRVQDHDPMICSQPARVC